MATNQSLLTIWLQLQLLTMNVIDLQSNYRLGFRVLGFRLALLLSQMCNTTPLNSTPKWFKPWWGMSFAGGWGGCSSLHSWASWVIELLSAGEISTQQASCMDGDPGSFTGSDSWDTSFSVEWSQTQGAEKGKFTPAYFKSLLLLC